MCTRGCFECSHGERRRGEEGRGRSSPVLFTKMAHVEVSLSPERFTESNHWMLPISSLRTGREQHFSVSSNHSQNLTKLFNSTSPEGDFGECATSTNTHNAHTHTTTTHSNTARHTSPTHTTRRQRGRERRQDKTRQDKTRQDKTRQDKTRQDKTRQDKTRQDKTRQDKTRQDKTRQDCSQWATLRESWFLLSFVCACFEFLTTLTFRALHGNRIMSTLFQTIVEEDKQKIVAHVSVHTLTFHETHYLPPPTGNPWTIQ